MADQKTTTNADAGDTANDPAPQAEAPKQQYVTVQQLNAALTSKVKGLEAKLEEFLSKVSSPKEEPAEKKPADDVSKRIASLEAALTKSQAEATSAKQKQLDVQLRQRVGEELSKVGVASSKHAMALLVDSEKRVAYDDEGNLVFKLDDGTQSDLADGLKNWAKTPDAKLYLAPRGTAGSGDRGVPSIAGSPAKALTKEDGGRMLLDIINGRVS